jgi:ketosteroid isomerase-like protein
MGNFEFEDALAQGRAALNMITRGDPSGYKALYSQNEDITLGNPFGGFARGKDAVYERLERAASYYRDGEPATYETIAKSVGEDLAYTVEIERVRTKVDGREDLSDVAIRVTSIYRRESDGWKLVHRHADPAVGRQRPDSVIQS